MGLAVIITGRPRRFLPAWWHARCARRVAELADANPGFERFVLQAHPAPSITADRFVDSTIEPDARRLLSRCMKLDPPVTDDDPYILL